MSLETRLDRSRPYGEIFPRGDREAFVQNYKIFDAGGNFVRDDGTPPIDRKPQTEAKNGPSQGAVSSSGTGLVPRTEMEWTTMSFPEVRNLLLREKGYKAPNKVAAMRYLDSQNLIVKG